MMKNCPELATVKIIQAKSRLGGGGWGGVGGLTEKFSK